MKPELHFAEHIQASDEDAQRPTVGIILRAIWPHIGFLALFITMSVWAVVG